MDEARCRERLLSRRVELDEEERISAAARAPVALEQDAVGRLSRMDAMQQQAMAQASQRRRDAEKQRIAAALARLDEGEWGWCVTCGEAIAQARLDHDPSVAQCLGCAAIAAG